MSLFLSSKGFSSSSHVLIELSYLNHKTYRLVSLNETIGDFKKSILPSVLDLEEVSEELEEKFSLFLRDQLIYDTAKLSLVIELLGREKLVSLKLNLVRKETLKFEVN